MPPTRTRGLGEARDSILLVANYESDVGYAWWLMERFWAAIAAAAANEGRRCVLAYPSIRRLPDVVQQAPLEVVEFDVAPRSWMAAWRGVRFIRRHRIVSVYLTDWPYFHPVYLAWRLVGVRRIVIHDHSPGDRPTLRGPRAVVKRLLHRTRVFAATSYVGVSPYIRRRLLDNCQVPSSRAHTVTNGIQPLECVAGRRDDVRRGLDVPDDAVIIALVSRATKYKNLGFALRCVAGLLADRTIADSVYAIHCGDGPELESLRQEASGMGLDQRFRFLGRRDDVREILCACDVGFHPSHGEAMSLAVLELMSAGLAVVVSDRPSVSTAIDHGHTGLTYVRDDAESAILALRRLLAEPATRSTLGAAAARRVQRDYTFEAMDAAFESEVLPLL